MRAVYDTQPAYACEYSILNAIKMAKNKEITDEQVQDAAAEALAEEILTLQNELQQERTERKGLQEQLNALRESIANVTNSVNIAPPPPAPLERPVVSLPDGTRLRFKAGAFKAGGKLLVAAEVADSPELLAQIIEKYPGIFEPA